MNPKNTWLLVFVTAGLFAFIFFYERHQHQAAPEVIRVMPDFNAQDVSAIQIQLAHQLEIRLERTNGGWQFVKPLAYPAQAAAVENLLQAVTDLSPQTHISAQELKGRPGMNEEYGFDNPQATLVFEQSGEQRQLKLGRLTAPGDQIYAQVVGLDRVDIVDADFFKKFVPHQWNDWRDTAFVNLKGRAFDRVTAANGGQILFELRRDGTNQPWRMEHPVRARADNPKIAELLYRLENLRVTKFVTDDAQADLESYGLQPAALELDLDDGTNRVLAAQFGKSPTNDARAVFARRSGPSNVVQVTGEFIKAWTAGFQEFRDRHLVRLTGGLPDAVEMTAGAEDFTVERQTNDSWRVTRPFEFPADTNLMREFMVNLDALEVVRAGNQVAVNDAALPDSDFPGYGLDHPARKYILKRNVPAGASNGVLAELDFGVVKDGRIFARRADRPEETSVYAISPDDFAKLPRTALELRERRIWNFSEDDVAKIRIRQNGQTQELDHKSQNHWSIAAGSQGMINELQVEVGAQELGFLGAQDWIERGDADKARYGFDGKSPQISVELKAGGPTMSFKLGGKSPGGLRYGDTRLEDGENWIFEIPAVVLDRLTSYFNLPENAGP